ncbi:MAG: glycosyltransferase family 2 protein, partial [Paludibacteraceae bacterium]
MENNPLISVIMPLYNAALYVEEAIQSVVNQTYTDWELIIVDDGSTDDSLAVVKRYESDKIRVYTQPNSGACVARNKALSLAQGAFVKFLDADDLVAPDCLEKQVAQIQTLAANQIPV